MYKNSKWLGNAGVHLNTNPRRPAFPKPEASFKAEVITRRDRRSLNTVTISRPFRA